MRLKTIGFEQNTLAPNSEVHEAIGNPTLVTNYDANSGSVALWDSATDTWDSLTVNWPVATFGASYEPNCVRSGLFALQLDESQQIRIPATTNNGGAFFRLYARFESLPATEQIFASFQRGSDDKNMAYLTIDSAGTLKFYCQDDDDVVATEVGTYSGTVATGQYYLIEFALTGNEGVATRFIEARVNSIQFAATNITNTTSTDGHLAIGTGDAAADAYTFCVDDVAINDPLATLADVDNNTWCGEGKVVILPVADVDNLVENSGWTRGGTDTGTDWGQVAEPTPNNVESYLVGSANDTVAEFRLISPYDAGLLPADTIRVVVANAHWKLEGASDTQLEVYLRAGSGLSKQASSLTLSGETWQTGSPESLNPDILTIDRLPQYTQSWSVAELSAARVGIEVTNAGSAVDIASVWLMVEYRPSAEVGYSVEIGGVDRTDEVIFGSLKISDRLNEVADTCEFRLADNKDRGMPETADEIVVTTNGVVMFAGTVASIEAQNLGNLSQEFEVKCIDYTRILDRRMVSATFTNLTDKAIIEQIIDEYCAGEGITTYFVAETATIAQISFNYVPVSDAIQQIADLTGANWVIDYAKNLRYNQLESERAPFDITATGNQFSGLSIAKDSTRIRNRIYVRGGNTLTTTPLTISVAADGQQRVFLLPEKPHNLTMTVGGVAKTIGIKNIDEADAFDYLLNYQEKYVEAGDLTATLAAGTVVEFTFDYNVPILVSYEDSTSIAENGVFEYAIIDKQIASTDQAIERAIAELTDYANDIVSGSYITEVIGLKSGQYQRVTFANKDVDAAYVIESVTHRSLGNGKFETSVNLASAKTLGIIRFLINLLQLNRRVGEFNEDEQVDQLLSQTDTLTMPADSVVDTLGGTDFNWDDGTGTTTDKLQWNLGSWG